MGFEADFGQGAYALRLMPSWGLWGNGRKIEVSLRQQRLLAFLAVQGTCRRELVAGVLWPESPEHSALDNLRVSIHRVTSALPGLLRADRHAVELSPRVPVDLHREWELISGTGTGAGGLHPGATGLLLGWYEDWVLDEQSRLQRARTAYWRRAAGEALARRDYAGAVESATQGLHLDVLDEAALETMVVAQLGLGQCISALQAIVGFRRRASSELGIAGSPTLDRLEARVRHAAQASFAGFPGGGPGSWFI